MAWPGEAQHRASRDDLKKVLRPYSQLGLHLLNKLQNRKVPAICWSSDDPDILAAPCIVVEHLAGAIFFHEPLPEF